MTEEQEQGEIPQSAPPGDTGPPPHDPAGPPSGREAPPRLPLGEWRGPAFWMACGALLAGMAGGAVILAQRVSVERDMMAVAATLPPAAAGGQVAPGEKAEPPRAAAAVKAETGATEAIAPGPVAGQPKRLARGNAARFNRPGHALQRATPAKPHRPLSAAAIRKWRAAEEPYAEVFRRCPRPGEAGAIRCRHDICNGAEGKGPACKAYVRKSGR